MSDGFEGCWKALETHPMVEDAESLAREAWKMGREFGKGDTVMVKPLTQSQVDEYLAENARLREQVKQLTADIAHHNQGWDACVVENNELREQVGRIDKLENLAASLGCAWFYGDFSPETKNESEMLEMMTNLGYVYKDEDELIDAMFRVRKVTPPQTTEGE